MPANDYGPLYEGAGRQYNIDPSLLRAVVSVESGGNPQAVSSAGAQGVAQLMPATAGALGVTDATDPAQAIPAAARLLAQNLDRYGNVGDALRAYHGGTDQSAWGPQTQAYPGKVMSALQSAPTPPPAAPPDAFSAAFGDVLHHAQDARPVPGAAAAPGAGPDAFTAAFGDPLKSRDAPNASAPQSDTGDLPAAPVGPSGPHPYNWLRDLVADEPGKTIGSVLPLAKDNATGAISLALPEMLRQPVRGLADLVEGAGNAARGIPQPAVLSPDAANALMSIATARLGGARPAAGAANALIREDRATPVPSAAAPPTAPNQLGVSAEQPMPGAALPPPGDQPVGAAASQQQPGAPGASAGPAGAATPVPSAAAPPALPPITDKAPPKPLLPILTKAQAEAQADRVIAHFARGGPTDVNSAELVPGSRPTLAQATGNPGIGALEKGYQANPQFNNALTAQKDAGDAARLDALTAITGTPADIEAAQAGRDAATAELRDQAFSDARPVNSQPVVQAIDDILASPEGQRNIVQSALQDIRSKLAQPVGDGTYERYQADPEQLYGIRKAINDSLSPLAVGTAADKRLAAAELGKVKAILDTTIEQGAPGFGKYIDEYAKQSAPIDAMAYLQKQNLTDNHGNITLAKLDTTIKAIQKKQTLNGINDASSVSDDQLQGLMNLRDDMRRAATKPTSRVPGSDTFQNLGTNAIFSQVAGNPIINLPIGALGTVSPTAAATMFVARSGANRMVSRGNRLVEEALHERLLDASKGSNALISKAKPRRSP